MQDYSTTARTPQPSFPSTTIERTRLRQIEDIRSGHIFYWMILEGPADTPTGTVIQQYVGGRGRGKRSEYAKILHQITGFFPEDGDQIDWEKIITGTTCRITIKYETTPLGMTVRNVIGVAPDKRRTVTT